MAASVTDVPKLTLEISCTGFPHGTQDPPRDEIVAKVVEFLAANGMPAEPGTPNGIGAAAGVPELLKAVSLSMKAGRILAKIRAERARRQVRDHLPTLTVRLESSVERGRSEWALPAAIHAANILATLGELSTLLRREYPLVEFNYFISAATGTGSWVNVSAADDRLTYSVVHRLIRKIDSKSTGQWTRVSFRRQWWCPWGWISSKSAPLDDAEWDCRDPRIFPTE